MRPLAFISVIFSGFFLTLPAQNLLPDGGFEQLTSSLCADPDDVIERSPFWYPLEATPDLYINGCQLDPGGSFFWDEKLKSFAGNHYAGLASRWNSNGTYVSEGLASSLNQPLEAGRAYYFQMMVRNRGSYQGAVSSASLCALEPERHLDLYGLSDSIMVVNDTSNGTSSTNAHLLTEVKGKALDGKTEGEWEEVSACFIAQGGETHLALMMPLGTFGPLPACASNQASSGVFHSFYFQIDELNLIELPRQIELPIDVCEFGSFEVNLWEQLDFSLKEAATYIWADGYEGYKRSLSERRPYEVEALLDCGIIHIQIVPRTNNCEPVFYVPTAFSPNGDGRNDSFRPFFDADLGVERYQFAIYNRWGNRVFRSQDSQQGWEGYSNGHPAPEGTYVWQLDCELSALGQGRRLIRSGSVFLMR